MPGHRWLLLGAFLIPFLSTALKAQASTFNCTDSPQVIYSEPAATLLSHVTVVDSATPDLSTQNLTTRSPQGTRWFTVFAPNTATPGPWQTTITVSGAGKGSPLLRLQFSDHASGGVQALWLNEKLLFIRAWWGRIASTDSIFDVQAKRWLYREDANYFALTIPPCTPGTQ